MLGENTGQSFVVGYGKNGGPLRPYHKASSCPAKPKKCGWAEKNSEDPNPNPLYGALVSGPNILDEFKDDRSDFQHSAVGLTNNAGSGFRSIYHISYINIRQYFLSLV